MKTQEGINQLGQFREQVYQSIEYRADAMMDLIDALSSNTMGRSVVELSLNECYRRGYSSITDAIDNFIQGEVEQVEKERREKEEALMRIISEKIPPPKERRYWLFAVDVTSNPRRFAKTLPDRGYVYQPNTIRSNKPVTIGHKYSVSAYLPEKVEIKDPPWVVTMLMDRVKSHQKETVVGADQVDMLMSDEILPWHKELCVEVTDSRYSTPEYLGRATRHENLITIARVRGNRTLYRRAVVEGKQSQGHPKWYGERFSLKDPTTWGEPDETFQTTHTSRRGNTYTVIIEAWKNLIMRGKKDIPMHKYPFTLVRVQLFDADGNLLFKRPLWLIVIGNKRNQLSLLEVYQAYTQRYDIDHFFRFAKQKLLLTSYQTPDDIHEESWWQIVQLAYVQLWLARYLANRIPRPWEKYLPSTKASIASPSFVQRDFGRIIRQIGSPASSVKPRGKSPGRLKGVKQGRRIRHPVIKKDSKVPKKTLFST